MKCFLRCSILLLIAAFSSNIQAQQSNILRKEKTQKHLQTSPRKLAQPSIQNSAAIKTRLQNRKAISDKKSIQPIVIEYKHRALEIRREKAGQRPFFVKGKIDSPFQKSNSTAPLEAKAIDYLKSIKDIIQIKSPTAEFELKSQERDAKNMEHLRFQQRYKGIKVHGGEVILHAQDGEIVLMNGRYFQTPNIRTVASLDKVAVAKSAIEDIKKNTTFKAFSAKENKLFEGGQSESELIIFHKDINKNEAKLAYHVTVRPNIIERWEYFIDAHSGAVLDKYNHTCSLDHNHDAHRHNHAPQADLLGPTTATDIDLNGSNRTINTYDDGSKYIMIDVTRPMYNGNFSDPEGAIVTLDLQQTNLNNPSYVEITSPNNVWNDPVAVSAHYNAGQVYEYFAQTHNRNSINGSGGNIVSFIHIRDENGQPFDNAFWNGQYIFYGDGNQAFSPLAGALDVAAHEFSHGVVSNTANLEYRGQSGAINESMADVFGVLVDRDDWKLGEEIVFTSAFPSGALRDLQNPNNGGSSLSDPGYQPMHMNQIYTGSQDNGGVHINSGIPNHAFYEFATAIGKDKAEQVYYRALTNYLTQSSQFIDLRLAVIQSTTDLYGNTEINAARAAFDDVGITDGQGGNYEEEVEVNPGDDFLLLTNTLASDNNTLYIANTDGTNEQAISATPLFRKPSITDDGTFALFVTDSKEIHFIELQDTDNNGTLDEFALTNNGIWDNVAISKDGTKMAALSINPDYTISVYDFITEQWKDFELYNPTYSEGVNTGEVLYADAIEWDFSGERVIYDAFNQLAGAGGEALDYWDVGFLQVWDNTSNQFGDGLVSKLFSSLPEKINVANPTFSKNSPNIIAFEIINDADSSIKLFTANIERNKTIEVYTNTVLSYPNFSKNDDKIVFDAQNASSRPVIATVSMQSDKITPIAGSITGVIGEFKWPIWYSTGERTTPTADIPALNGDIRLFPNPFSESVSVEMEVTERADVQVSIYDIMGRLVSSKQENLNTGFQQIQLNTADLSPGAYLMSIRINGQVASKKMIKK